MLVASDAQSSGPELAFDMSPCIECTDVTPADFAATHPDQRVIEAVFRISLRLKQGALSDVREVVIEMVSTDQRLTVFDFSPEAVLESPVEGSIEITRTKEQGSTIGAGLNGGTSIPYGGVNVQLSPHASLGKSNRDLETEKVQRIPEKKAVLIGGTMNAGYGVFFKLRPSTQTPLEGRKEFRVRYIVPATWRADWLTLSCKAVGQHTEYFMKKLKVSGQSRLDVGLYLAGDNAAYAAAMQLAAAQGLAPHRRASSRVVAYKISSPKSANAKPERQEPDWSDRIAAMFIPHYGCTKSKVATGVPAAEALKTDAEFDRVSKNAAATVDAHSAAREHIATLPVLE